MNITIFKEVIENGKMDIHFHSNLRGDEGRFYIESSFDYELTQTKEGQYFSDLAKEAPERFYKLTIPVGIGEIEFLEYKTNKFGEEKSYRVNVIPRRLSIYANQNQFEPITGTNIVTTIRANRLMFIELSQKFVTTQIFDELNSMITKDIYLFHDRRNKADDNAEALYRYYMNEEPELFANSEMCYVIEEGCPDYYRLQADGFKVVALNSQRHKVLYSNAKAILTANALPRTFNPFGDTYISNTDAKIIALNHGVISNDLGNVLNRNSRINHMACTVGKYDYELYKGFAGFSNLQITGLARFDNYESIEDENYIMYFPTWNKKYIKNLYSSRFYKEIINFITDPAINNLLISNGIKLKVLFHPLLADAILKNEKVFSKVSNNIEFLDVFESSFKQLLGSNKLLITDSSSVRYDNLFQHKNVITYAPYEKNNGESMFDESKMFTDVESVEEMRIQLEKMIYNDFAIDDSIVEAANDFFDTKPGENCRNIAEQVKLVLAGDVNEL